MDIPTITFMFDDNADYSTAVSLTLMAEGLTPIFPQGRPFKTAEGGQRSNKVSWLEIDIKLRPFKVLDALAGDEKNDYADYLKLCAYKSKRYAKIESTTLRRTNSADDLYSSLLPLSIEIIDINTNPRYPSGDITCSMSVSPKNYVKAEDIM